MSSIAYDRIKGLTPVGGKSSGQALKNSFHLHNQMHIDPNGNGQERENSVGLPYRQNMRGQGHTKMPSLPSNIKGSIGSISGAAGN